MKKLSLILAIFFALQAQAQTDAFDKDKLANNGDFQIKVRQASLTISNAIIFNADTATDKLIIKYGQLWQTQPQGSQITAMAYGVANDPSINDGSTQDQIQAVVGNIYIVQAYAWYMTPPPSTNAGNALIRQALEKWQRRH